jgi:WD40 repeat protein
VSDLACDPLGRWVATLYDDGRIRLYDVGAEKPPLKLQAPPGATFLWIAEDASFLEAVVTGDDGWQTSVWSLKGAAPTHLRQVDLGKPGGTALWALDPVADRLVSPFDADGRIRIWPLDAPADASPMVLRRGAGAAGLFHVASHPEGRWLAVSGFGGLTLWPMARAYPTLMDRGGEKVARILFGPEGQWLAASEFASGKVLLWSLEGEVLPAARTLGEVASYATGLASSPDGGQVLVATWGGPQLLSLGGEPPRTFSIPGGVVEGSAAISPDGQLATAFDMTEDHDPAVLRVWNVDSGDEVAVFEDALGDLQFTAYGRLLSSGSSGLRRWNLESGAAETVAQGFVGWFSADLEGHRAVLQRAQKYGSPMIGPATLLDLETGSEVPLTAHGDRVTAVTIDAAGTMVVTGDADGIVRVGPASGEEPHLLLGNTSYVGSLAIDPRGRWIASASGSEIRLWPIPDLSEPPLHTLPREELIARLHTLTNLRVVRDEASASGWQLTHEPFAGWETVPTW